jgi:hypothetical protein
LNSVSSTQLTVQFQIDKCHSQASCAFDLLILDDKRWAQFQQNTLDIDALAGKLGMYVNVTSIPLTTIPLDSNTYRVVLFNPGTDGVLLSLYMDYAPIVTCFAAIVSAMGLLGLIALCILGCWCCRRRSQTPGKQAESALPTINIPLDQLADESYFLRMPVHIPPCANHRWLHKLIKQPHTKFLYWFRQQWRFTAPFYPEFDEVLTTYE